MNKKKLNLKHLAAISILTLLFGNAGQIIVPAMADLGTNLSVGTDTKLKVGSGSTVDANIGAKANLDAGSHGATVSANTGANLVVGSQQNTYANLDSNTNIQSVSNSGAYVGANIGINSIEHTGSSIGVNVQEGTGPNCVNILVDLIIGIGSSSDVNVKTGSNSCINLFTDAYDYLSSYVKFANNGTGNGAVNSNTKVDTNLRAQDQIIGKIQTRENVGSGNSVNLGENQSRYTISAEDQSAFGIHSQTYYANTGSNTEIHGYSNYTNLKANVDEHNISSNNKSNLSEDSDVQSRWVSNEGSDKKFNIQSGAHVENDVNFKEGSKSIHSDLKTNLGLNANNGTTTVSGIIGHG